MNEYTIEGVNMVCIWRVCNRCLCTKPCPNNNKCSYPVKDGSHTTQSQSNESADTKANNDSDSTKGA